MLRGTVPGVRRHSVMECTAPEGPGTRPTRPMIALTVPVVVLVLKSARLQAFITELSSICQVLRIYGP
jgi:hypothetical protein